MNEIRLLASQYASALIECKIKFIFPHFIPLIPVHVNSTITPPPLGTYDPKLVTPGNPSGNSTTPITTPRTPSSHSLPYTSLAR